MIIVDDIGPDDTSDEIINRVKELIAALESNNISKQNALELLYDIQQDIKFRKSMFDSANDDKIGYASIELFIKLVEKDISSKF